jgi:hypothetical protein
MTMDRMGSYLLAPFRFLYHFIIGDDWTVAVVVFVGLVISWLLNSSHIVAFWLIPLIVIVMTGISLRRHRARR